MGGQQEGICPSYHHAHPGHVVNGGATELIRGLEEHSTNVITVRAVNRAGISDPTTSTIRITTQTASKATHLEIKAMIVWLCDHPGAYENLPLSYTLSLFNSLCSSNWISSECQEYYSYLLRYFCPVG